jgi:hypothetical protein
MKLHEICGYLPFGLQCHAMGEYIEGTEYNDISSPKLFTATGMFKDSNGAQYIEAYYESDQYEIFFETDFFPILRPLSEIVREIEHNGEKFVPIDKIEDIYPEYIREDFDMAEWIIDSIVGNENANGLPHGIVQKLIEYHFDIFNFIESGQAIDINTLK